MKPSHPSHSATAQRLLNHVTIGVLLVLEWLCPIRTTHGALVGHWTFDNGSPIDLTGHFEPLMLYGTASIEDGDLVVQSNGTYGGQQPAGWAKSSGYTGPTIADKTLVGWVNLNSLDTQGAGSIITIDSVTADTFDGIVFGEIEANRWLPGSSFHIRSQNFVPGFEESMSHETVLMAFTYAVSGNDVTITGYRNGALIGQYTTANSARWTSGDTEVVFGTRHFSQELPWGGLNARIAEARIYDTVLSQDDILTLSMLTLSDPTSSTKVEWRASGTVVDVLEFPKGPEGLNCFSAIGDQASVRATVSEDFYHEVSRATSTGWLTGTFSETHFAAPYSARQFVSEDGTSPSNYVTSDRFRFQTTRDPANASSISLAAGSVSAGLFQSEWADSRGCRYSVVGKETSRVDLKTGDVTGDHIFDSSDLVAIFTTGKYENDVAANWYEGDWNFDNRFDTSDLIEAFKTGAYEKPAATTAAVPEPSARFALLAALPAMAFRPVRRRCRSSGVRRGPL